MHIALRTIMGLIKWEYTGAIQWLLTGFLTIEKASDTTKETVKYPT